MKAKDTIKGVGMESIEIKGIGASGQDKTITLVRNTAKTYRTKSGTVCMVRHTPNGIKVTSLPPKARTLLTCGYEIQ